MAEQEIIRIAKEALQKITTGSVDPKFIAELALIQINAIERIIKVT